ncbi:hypothetical protein L226DRAFT_554331 [Lentinus tigrinus ALCF2SS1-7]|uniref:Extracellular membrane protein CFEM domain-containing protein n=1 Tax=Lentinus tigrinus ALCF2SS1-6 TaxID=1328759 RepID=A0A5C2S0U6_9APHY|nr:hypothetical protein L227DRAFT_602737 [Lentinus tigrinus ALCF2SS1-6]RPD71760.1 hypothetical protein L226DRAFT_554331 [Lentinus tigrinus ALCF2SS1-7]
MIAIYAALISLVLSPVARSAPTGSLDASIFLQNGKDAQALNAVFANMSSSDSCDDGEMACISNSLAHCVNATWQLEACSKSLSCFALPSVKEQGVDISCTTNTTALAIINASGATGGIAANSTDGSVELPMDCDDDNESDPVDNAAGSESSSVSVPISTSASTSASATHTHKSSHSTTDSAVASSVTASATDVSNSTRSVVTVTVTVAPTSTDSSETFTLDPSQASSLLSSLATQSGVSITTILPSSASVASTTSAASVTSSAVSSAEASSATVVSSKQVGVASSPSSSLPAISAGPIKTITLLGQVASTSSAKATATAAAAGDGYSY